MGLLVGDHLQAMLDGAQEHVRRLESRRLRRRSSPAREPFERRSVSRPRSAGMTAAGDQLLGLHEKLDLANAAAAELDIVAFDRDFAVATIRMDLPLHVVDVGRGRRSRDICAR